MSRSVSCELWGWCNPAGAVYWTAGGSSTKPKLMLYESKARALAQRKWAPADAEVRLIHSVMFLEKSK